MNRRPSTIAAEFVLPEQVLRAARKRARDQGQTFDEFIVDVLAKHLPAMLAENVPLAMQLALAESWPVDVAETKVPNLQPASAAAKSGVESCK